MCVVCGSQHEQLSTGITPDGTWLTEQGMLTNLARKSSNGKKRNVRTPSQMSTTSGVMSMSITISHKYANTEKDEVIA